MLLGPLCEVEGDEVDIEIGACLLQRPLVGGTCGDQIIVLLELRQEVVRGGVGHVEVTSSKNAERGRGGEW